MLFFDQSQNVMPTEAWRVAAVGLWIGAMWGPVMWAVAVLVECAMYTILADRFGSYPWRVSVHLMLFGLFLILAGIDWHRAKRG